MPKPICPYFGKCGGCAYQDVEYTVQLERKTSQLTSLTQFDEIKVISGKQYHYRNRMDLAFHADGLGFRKRGSWSKIIDIEKCAISNQKLNALLKEIRKFFNGVFCFDPKRKNGTFCYAVIRTPPKDSSVSLVLNKDSESLEKGISKIKEYACSSTAENVIVTLVPCNRNVSTSENYMVIKGRDMLLEKYRGFLFYFPVQGFFQVNHEVAEKIHTYCSKRFASYNTQAAHLLDLYGGVGTFGIINASYFHKVTMVENFPPSLKASRKNILLNRAKNARVIARDAKYLKGMDLPSPLFILLDPPRSGMHPKTLKQINELKAEMILYVSCNPKLLEKDLQELDHYQVKSMALFDMFPQTPHMEAVVELVKK